MAGAIISTERKSAEFLEQKEITDMDTNEDFLGRIRYPEYHDRIMSAEKAAGFIKPEMTLGVSGFTIAGYPKAVAGELAKRARNGEKL